MSSRACSAWLFILLSAQTIADSFHQLAHLIVYASSIEIAFSLKEHARGWHQLLTAFNNSVLSMSLVIARETTDSSQAEQPSIIPAFPNEVTEDL